MKQSSTSWAGPRSTVAADKLIAQRAERSAATSVCQ
jgi:hypothetical protein